MKNNIVFKALLGKPQMPRRIVMLIIGHLIMGLSVALLRLVALGTDPFSAMMLALTNKTPLDYGTFCAIANCSFFVIVLLWGRRYIGLGTIINWFLLGYIVAMMEKVLKFLSISSPESLVGCISLCVIAIIILGFSLSLYQSADSGSAPYDAIPLIMYEKLHIPFFAARVILDGTATLVAFLNGGVVGLGTLLIFFGLGPIAHFFNKKFSEKLLKKSVDKTHRV